MQTLWAILCTFIVAGSTLRGHSLSSTFVYNGYPVVLPCGPATGAYNRSYWWMYHGLANSSSNVKMNAKNGDLIFDSVSAGQAGRYDCWVRGTTENEESIGFCYQHRLIPYTIPTRSVTVTYSFSKLRCLKAYIGNFAADYLKSLCGNFPNKCPFFAQHRCRSAEEKNLQNDKGNFEIILYIFPAVKLMPPSCGKECLNETISLHFEYLKNLATWHLDKIITDKQGVSSVQKAPITYREHYEMFRGDCPPGFMYSPDATCIACSPGSYWAASEKLCLKCPVNTYQDHGGALTCSPCPQGHKTEDVGTFNARQCITGGNKTSVLFIKSGTNLITFPLSAPLPDPPVENDAVPNPALLSSPASVPYGIKAPDHIDSIATSSDNEEDQNMSSAQGNSDDFSPVVGSIFPSPVSSFVPSPSEDSNVAILPEESNTSSLEKDSQALNYKVLKGPSGKKTFNAHSHKKTFKALSRNKTPKATSRKKSSESPSHKKTSEILNHDQASETAIHENASNVSTLAKDSKTANHGKASKAYSQRKNSKIASSMKASGKDSKISSALKASVQNSKMPNNMNVPDKNSKIPSAVKVSEKDSKFFSHVKASDKDPKLSKTMKTSDKDSKIADVLSHVKGSNDLSLVEGSNTADKVKPDASVEKFNVPSSAELNDSGDGKSKATHSSLSGSISNLMKVLSSLGDDPVTAEKSTDTGSGEPLKSEKLVNSDWKKHSRPDDGDATPDSDVVPDSSSPENSPDSLTFDMATDPEMVSTPTFGEDSTSVQSPAKVHNYTDEQGSDLTTDNDEELPDDESDEDDKESDSKSDAGEPVDGEPYEDGNETDSELIDTSKKGHNSFDVPYINKSAYIWTTSIVVAACISAFLAIAIFFFHWYPGEANKEEARASQSSEYSSENSSKPALKTRVRDTINSGKDYVEEVAGSSVSDEDDESESETESDAN